MATTKRERKTTDQTTYVTRGSTIRIETPHSARHAKTNPAIVIVQENNPVTGFVQFIREHAVVGLAIGFILGQQAQGLVKQLVGAFIDPAFKLLFGTALSERMFTIHWHGRSANFSWGSFAYSLLNFLFVMMAIYAIVKILNLDDLDKPKDEPKPKK